MNKKIIIAIVGVVLVGGAGAAYIAMNSNSSATNNDQRRTTERNNQPEMGRNSLNTTPATIDDLQVGEEITVIGSSNTDGSMTAQTILIGSIDEGFTPPEGGFSGGGQGGMPGSGARMPGGQGFGGGNMVRGEILDIDDITITIALPDGGSRLVLYSSQTTVSKISE